MKKTTIRFCPHRLPIGLRRPDSESAARTENVADRQLRFEIETTTSTWSIRTPTSMMSRGMSSSWSVSSAASSSCRGRCRSSTSAGDAPRLSSPSPLLVEMSAVATKPLSPLLSAFVHLLFALAPLFRTDVVFVELLAWVRRFLAWCRLLAERRASLLLGCSVVVWLVLLALVFRLMKILTDLAYRDVAFCESLNGFILDIAGLNIKLCLHYANLCT